MKKIYLFLLAIPFVVWACPAKKDTPPPVTTIPTPKTCFSVNKILFDSGETVVFTNCSKNAGSYIWNFGDGLGNESFETNPTHLFPNSRTSYHVTLTSYSTDVDKSKHSDSSADVYEGFRQIDSVKLISFTGFSPGTDILFQMGPSVNNSMYSAPDRVINSLPATFAFSPGIKINSTNNTYWAGHIFNNTTHQSLYPWGAGKNVFFSRGLNASPITVNDGFGINMLVYYSLVKN
jgi:PKD repeat protein